MAKRARRKRQRYTDQQRTQILEAARKDGLTAADVQKKFGVTPVTYYSWRKKSGTTRRRRGSVAAAAGRSTHNGDFASQMHRDVQARVRQVLPEIVRAEVNAYIDEVLSSTGTGTRRRRRRRRARTA